MFLAKSLHLLAACLLALFALGANARAMDDLQAQNTLLEKIELLPLHAPHAWRAQAVDSPEENTCFYDDGASGPTHYNYFRSYQPTQGRYTQGDPIGLGGGLNRYGYANGAPTMYTDPLGLEAGVTVWQPSGWGSSSFGHVSTNINGTTFSFGPQGMSKLPTADYNAKNDFRSGMELNLKLSPQQEAALQACLSKPQGKYNAVTNNCGDPVQDCLKGLGINTGGQIFPANLGNKLIDMGITNGVREYPQSRAATGSSAPWAR